MAKIELTAELSLRKMINESREVAQALTEFTDKLEQIEKKYAEEQEPKGHWIEHSHEAGPNWEYSRYECSECHEWADDDSDFCPECGADMREVKE